MNITQLKYFTIVAQLENVSKAAEYLHMTQSSLSKNLLKIEEEVGAPLFDRHGKKLVLNERGARFLTFCNHTLREMDELEGDIRQLSGGQAARIHIALAGDMERMFDCMARFRKDHENAVFDVDGRIEYADHADINAYDVVVYPDEPRFRKFKGYDLCREQFYFAGKKTGQDKYVFLGEGEQKEFAFRIFSAMNIRNTGVFFVNSRETHLKMIASSLACGYVPEGLTDMYEKNGILLSREEDVRFTRELKICFKREKHLSDLAKEFRTFAMEYYQIAAEAD